MDKMTDFKPGDRVRFAVKPFKAGIAVGHWGTVVDVKRFIDSNEVQYVCVRPDGQDYPTTYDSSWAWSPHVFNHHLEGDPAKSEEAGEYLTTAELKAVVEVLDLLNGSQVKSVPGGIVVGTAGRVEFVEGEWKYAGK